MDALLSRVTQHAVQYAIRSGISITTGYAIKECGRLLKQAPRGREREELMQLQLRLDSKIRVISPSIDMIELIAARGNTSLGSAVSLTKDLRYEIQKLGQRLESAANEERMRTSKKTREEKDFELKAIIGELKALLARIEDAVPLINLAITTSGVNLSTNLSGTISPSRLLQASTFLTAADKQYISDPDQRQQVGPTYVVSLYMLFAGHASRAVDVDGIRQTTWQEVVHKARLKLWRVPLDQLYALPGEQTEVEESGPTGLIPAETKAAEFAYQLVLVEDLDDDRVHEEKGDQFDDVEEAGLRDVVPIHEVSKIFYADTGKILNIGNDGDGNNPVLLMKRDVHADPPRRMLQRTQSRTSMAEEAIDHEEGDDQTQIDAQFERESAPPTPQKNDTAASAESTAKRLPTHLDPEWMAFEVYVEDPDDSASDTEDEPSRPPSSRTVSIEAGLTSALSHLKLGSSLSPQPNNQNQLATLLPLSPRQRAGPPVKTSLSLLEMLIKLTALQQFRQESHLAIEDELLNFFLEDSSTAGAGADKAYRQRLRRDAAERVGFDPYDESPIKRRGEDYIRHGNIGASPRDSPHSSPVPLAYDEDYGYEEDRSIPRLDFNTQPHLDMPNSPSPPRRPPYQQTPSRSSTPDLTIKTNSPRPRQPLATPPSSSGMNKTRTGALRGTQNEQKPRSPLHEVTYGDGN